MSRDRYDEDWGGDRRERDGRRRRSNQVDEQWPASPRGADYSPGGSGPYSSPDVYGHQYGSDPYDSGQYGTGQPDSSQYGTGQPDSGQYGTGQPDSGQYGSGRYDSGAYGAEDYGTGRQGAGSYGYDSSDPYGRRADSGSHTDPGSRTDPYALSDPYGRSSSGGRPDPYGQSDQYGQPERYGQPDGYGQADPYGQRDAYSEQYDRRGGYDSQGYESPGGYRNSGGYDAPDPYAGQQGSGPHGYGGAGNYRDSGPYAGQAAYRDDASGGYDNAGGYDDYGRVQRSGPHSQYPDQGADYGRPDDDRGGPFGWQDADDADAGRFRRRGRRSAVGKGDPADGPGHPADEIDADDARHNGFFRGFGNDDDEYGHRPRPGRRRGPGAGTIALIIIFAVIAGFGYTGYHYYSLYKQRHSSYSGSGFGSVMVMIKAGDSADSIGPELVRLGVLESMDPWASYVAGKPSSLQPGEFKLHKHMSPAAAWAMLINPKSRVNSTVTIDDGLRWSKILPMLAKQSGIPLSQFETAIKDTSALGLPSYAKGNPEGYLFPDTYDILPGQTSALQILQTAVKQFKAEASSLNLAAGAQHAQFTEGQVIIGASLLEAEVGSQPQYYKEVAEVIDNRLNDGMDLGLDTTVAYITNKYVYDLTTSELNVNSPYNTTNRTGLPPGPIDSPDAAAIEAFLNPDHGSYLYFVTINASGLTKFTSSYSTFLTWSAEAKRNLG